MKYLFIFLGLFGLQLVAAESADCASGDCPNQTTTVDTSNTQSANRSGLIDATGSTQNGAVSNNLLLQRNNVIVISAIGQGVAPTNTSSPAQAYALAKRAAIADGYRQIAEKVQGVEVEGQDLVKNMMIKRSTIRTAVHAMIKNANIVETNFRDGLCEVEMEIKLSYDTFAQH